MWKMCHEQRKISGRITLEAALLIPAVILWMAGLVLFMVFLLDMSVVKSEAIRIADEAAMMMDKEGDLETGEYKINRKKTIYRSAAPGLGTGRIRKSGSARFQKRIRERLVIASCTGTEVTPGLSFVRASGTVSYRRSFSGELPGGLSKGSRFTGKAAAPVNDWESLLWKASAVSAVNSRDALE
ncbi:MAG: hypothetical protein IJI25_04375 [Eubacterium sp.]|nr:hypothetical protein [Eubacterium sp.]